jgi:prepilin-type processing-associated H-X9-DG protein
LLIVVAILALVTTLYWGGKPASRQQQKQGACARNLEKIFIAMQIYATDHAGKFPEVAGARTSEQVFDLLVPQYSVDTSLFICPGSKDPPLPAGEPLLKSKVSYACYMGRRATDTQGVLMSDKQIDTKSKVAGQTAFSTTGQPPGNNHDQYGGNFLFGDGHVERSPASVPFSIMLTQGIVLLNPK